MSMKESVSKRPCWHPTFPPESFPTKIEGILLCMVEHGARSNLKNTNALLQCKVETLVYGNQGKRTIHSAFVRLSHKRDKRVPQHEYYGRCKSRILPCQCYMASLC